MVERLGRMTRELIENFREIVLPFVKNVLLKTNYENLGKSDAEEFEKHFNEVLDLAIQALEQEPILDRVRAEIDEVYEELDGCDPDSLGTFACRIDDILDKYKAKGEKV